MQLGKRRINVLLDPDLFTALAERIESDLGGEATIEDIDLVVNQLVRNYLKKEN